MKRFSDLAPVSLRRRRLADPDGSSYRVYKADGSFVAVQAPTAAEAFRMSGVDRALRIVRDTPYRYPLLDGSFFTGSDTVMEVPLPREEGAGDASAPAMAMLMPAGAPSTAAFNAVEAPMAGRIVVHAPPETGAVAIPPGSAITPPPFGSVEG